MKFIKDVVSNIIAQALFIIILQLVLFPKYEQALGQKEFGTFILLYAVLNIFTVTVATAYTNLYQKNLHLMPDEIKGRNNYYYFYRHLMIYSLILAVILTAMLSFSFKPLIVILLMLNTLLTTFRTYLLVYYRVTKSFSHILVLNLILSFLYGILYFIDADSVADILLDFLIVECIYIVVMTLYMKFDLGKWITSTKVSDVFTIKSINMLLLAGLAGSSINYIDRFIIDFFLSKEAIAEFYIATLATKLVLFPFNMMSSVVLSYIAAKSMMTSRLKKYVVIYAPLVSLAIFVVSYISGKIVIAALYPDYIDKVEPYYFAVNMAFAFICFDILIRSFILKFKPLNIKLQIDILTVVLYVIVSAIMLMRAPSLISLAYAQMMIFGLRALVQLYILYRLDTEKGL